MGNPKLPRKGHADLLKAWQQHGTVEACSPAPAGQVGVFTQHNLFAAAVHQAFYEHLPLVLSPDVIWLTIAQGLAKHVDNNAKALRDRFVDFQGKKTITVLRPGFVKGSPSNDWPGVFPDFESEIAKFVGTEITSEILSCNFSTTGPVERVASVITLMDTVKHYFAYKMRAGCGFPSIALKGTLADWVSVRRKAEALRRFKLGWWLDVLLPVLDQFVAAAQGSPDLPFWRSLCNMYGASGRIKPPVTGWLQVFFPYLADGHRSTGLKEYIKSYKNGVSLDNYRANAKNKREPELKC